MKISDLLIMCVRNLTRRKFRTVLTVVGVVIGTCMIIVMVSLGEGMQRQLDEMFNNFGDLTIIQVYSGWSGSEQIMLDDNSLTDIGALEGVATVTPFDYVNSQVQLYAGKNERYRMEYMDLIGVYPEALEELGYKAKEGRVIRASASTAKRVELLFGSTVAFQFEDTKRRRPNNFVYEGIDEQGNENVPFVNPMEEEDMIMRMTGWDSTAEEVDFDVSVVGIMEGGGSREYETQYSVFIDIREMKKMQEEYNKANSIKEDRNASTGYNNVRVKAATLKDVVAVEEAITTMGYGTFSMESMRKQMEEQNRQTQIILGAIGAISLLVATISIANTMVMSVYERTREIGVMKVLGCLVTNIRTIFLVEAGLIGFFGGIIGIALSYLLSDIINNIGANLGNLGGGGGGMMFGGMGGGGGVSIITLEMIGLGLAFATVIGLVAGFYPAYRAVKISALEAIKQE